MSRYSTNDYRYYYGSSLKHYGTPGMKWGVKNGPPYPIDRSKLPGNSGFANSDELNSLHDHFKPISDDVSFVENLKSSNEDHYSSNCKEVANTVAVRLSENLDVTAKDKSVKGNLHDYVNYHYGDADNLVGTVSGDSSNIQSRLEKQILKKYSDGDVGAVNIDFDPKYLRPDADESGHCFSWKIENNKVKFFDGQPEEPLEDASGYFKAIDPNKDAEYVKYNGLEPKEDRIDSAMRNRK